MVDIDTYELVTAVDILSMMPKNFYENMVRYSKGLLVYYYYCNWCNLNGYATRYLFVNRYRVAASCCCWTLFKVARYS